MINKDEILTVLTPAMCWIGTAFATFFMPILWAYWVVIVLVLADTITGVMSAGKDSVKNIKSRRAFSLAPKLIVYLLLVTVGAVAELTHKDVPFIKLVLLGVGYIEILSIDENFEKLTGFSFLKKILEAVKKVTKLTRKDYDEN